jgi:hypothetical protein
MAKKIAAVTFPNKRGCADDRSKVTNLDHLSKFGKLLKLSLQATGNIMKPFPHEHEVEFNCANGYGAFEKDGKAEVINLEFRKTPGAAKWNWHSVGSTPSELILNGSELTISPTIVTAGYEILPANVNKCASWY